MIMARRHVHVLLISQYLLLKAWNPLTIGHLDYLSRLSCWLRLSRYTIYDSLWLPLDCLLIVSGWLAVLSTTHTASLSIVGHHPALYKPNGWPGGGGTPILRHGREVPQ